MFKMCITIVTCKLSQTNVVVNVVTLSNVSEIHMGTHIKMYIYQLATCC